MRIQTFSIVAGSEACNANCPFCVSKMTVPNGVPSGRAPEVNWRNFRKACRLASQCGATTAMITSKGEPTLFPDQVTQYLEVMEEYDFPIIEIQSNGIPVHNKLRDDESHPERNGTGGRMASILSRWHSLGLTTFAISVVGDDPELNRKIYVPHLDKYIDLPFLIEALHDHGFSVRLACVMISGGIDDCGSVLRMSRFAKKHKVEQLTLRPVNKPDASQSRDDSTFGWVYNNHVDEEKLALAGKFLEVNGTKLMTLAHGGVVYDLEGQNVCLTHSLTRAPETDDLRQLIYFPNGRVKYDWAYEGAVIF